MSPLATSSDARLRWSVGVGRSGAPKSVPSFRVRHHGSTPPRERVLPPCASWGVRGLVAPIAESRPGFSEQIKGWAMYHRYAASKRTFTHVDYRIFRMVWRWCRRRHPNKGREWIKERYFRREGHRHWIFTGTLSDEGGPGRPIALMAAAAVRIIRYVKIRSAVNPYDPRWEPYLEARMGWQLTQTLTGRGRIESLWKGQEGRCLVCGQPLRLAEGDYEIHHRIWRSRGGADTADNLELLHANCHRQIHVQEGRTKAAASREGRS
jgi:RNA-directed DNA polymerase